MALFAFGRLTGPSFACAPKRRFGCRRFRDFSEGFIVESCRIIEFMCASSAEGFGIQAFSFGRFRIVGFQDFGFQGLQGLRCEYSIEGGSINYCL